MKTIPIVDLDFLIESAKKKSKDISMYYWNLSLDKDFSYKIRDEFEAYSWYHLFIWAGWEEK